MKYLLSFSILFIVTILSAQTIDLNVYSTGFDLPVDIAHAGDDRLFVVEKRGFIQIIDGSGNKLDTPFLNIDPIVNSNANERGLLGLTFHPNYSDNGYFFVYYTNNFGSTVVSRFSVSSDPNIADPNSEKQIIIVPQPFSNHNGGCIKFSPNDGYLYIGIGDGGAGGDPEDSGQSRLSLLGKILRLDVDTGTSFPYQIPEDNPYADDDFTADEIWTLGWRNPWRFSFDRETGDLWIADVGQDKWEEIDFEPAGYAGGGNYGWRCYEGDELFNFDNCDQGEEFIFPVFTYPNNFSTGCSVTGGFVYRGSENPSLIGNYIFADYCTGRFWMTRKSDCGFVTTDNFNGTNQEYSSFGEDVNGELYVTAIGEGTIYKISTACNALIVAELTQPSCPGASDGAINITESTGVVVDGYNWNNGETTEDLENLTAGEYVVTVRLDNGCSIERCFALEGNADSSSCSEGVIALDGCEGTPLELFTPCMVPEDYSIRWLRDNQEIEGETGTSITISQSGNYSIQFYNSECSLDTSLLYTVGIIPAPPAPSFIQDGNVLIAEIEATLYTWYLNGNIIQTGDSDSLEISESGNYALQITNAFGCVSLTSEEEFITLSNTLEALGIQNFQIFPNPFSDRIKVDLHLQKSNDYSISLIDNQGIFVFEKKFSNSGISHNIDTADLAPGIYLVTIEIQGKSISKKILKN